MRIVNELFETITEYDLTQGVLVETLIPSEDAVVPDDEKIFAYTNFDFEKVQMYIKFPTKTAKEQIAELEQQLAATDYKVVKCMEYQLLGLELPYDMAEVHAEREAIRAQIEQLGFES